MKFRVTHTETDREVFDLLVHSLNDHNYQVWARPQPGANSFFQVSHEGPGVLALGLGLCFSQAISRAIKEVEDLSLCIVFSLYICIPNVKEKSKNKTKRKNRKAALHFL